MPSLVPATCYPAGFSLGTPLSLSHLGRLSEKTGGHTLRRLSGCLGIYSSITTLRCRTKSCSPPDGIETGSECRTKI